MTAKNKSLISTIKRTLKQNPKSFQSIVGWFGLTFLAMLFLVCYQTLFTTVKQPAKLMHVKSGQSYHSILANWQHKPLFYSSTLAKLYVSAKTINQPLLAGTYQLPPNPNLATVIEAVSLGKTAQMVEVQIIEGKTAKDLYAKLVNTKGISIEALENPDALKSTLQISATTPTGEYANNLEGWFAPDTYFYAHGITDKQILQDLYKRQQAILAAAWETRAKNLPYKIPYEALIMASIIEKETGLADERAEVAGVFVNRLKKGMRLQTDPTIIYGMGDSYDGDIRRSDIKEKSDYNTYQIDGLPPTPIALPSKASIQAALNPANTNALYFVATGNGGHKFSNTLAEHNQAVQQYLEVMSDKNNDKRY